MVIISVNNAHNNVFNVYQQQIVPLVQLIIPITIISVMILVLANQNIHIIINAILVIEVCANNAKMMGLKAAKFVKIIPTK